jgi:hypothetical protein
MAIGLIEEPKPLPLEDAAEYRAYLQRGETRLSTFHRVAGSFISGAGLLTLLPVLINQTFSGLFAAMVFVSMPGLPPAGGWQRWLALVPVLASIALPLVALYLLIRELTTFYFTARSFRQDSSKRQYPRFILSGILVSTDNISDFDRLEVERKRDTVTDLVVPNTEPLMRRLLKEAQARPTHSFHNGDRIPGCTQDRIKKFHPRSNWVRCAFAPRGVG